MYYKLTVMSPILGLSKNSAHAYLLSSATLESLPKAIAPQLGSEHSQLVGGASVF